MSSECRVLEGAGAACGASRLLAGLDSAGSGGGLESRLFGSCPSRRLRSTIGVEQI
jgi:hypothetical protein